MTAVACPLCGSADTAPEASVGTVELARLYKRLLSVDVRRDLARDGVITLHACASCSLKFYDPPSEGGASLYDELQRYEWYYLQDKPEYHVALQHLPTGARVLEVGCGRGVFGRLLAADSLYTGLELSERAAKEAANSGLDVRVESTAEHLRADPARYDAVVSFQVLEHVPAPREFLQDCVELLADDGLLILSVPAEDAFVGAMTNNILNLPPHHVTRWPDRTFDHLEKLFPIEILAVVPDEMSDEHRADYATELLVRMLKLTPRPGSLVRSSGPAVFAFRVTRRIARRLSAALTDPRLVPRGHSVTVVARRRARTSASS